MPDFKALAEKLDTAARTATATSQISATSELELDDAYCVQLALRDRRLSRGERIVGVKMGFTSEAKARQMNVHEVIYGWLTDAMQVGNGNTINLDDYVHARVEPELAVRLGETIEPGATAAEAYAAVEAVAPAIEIIDSRYENFKFSLTDVVADNSSSSGFVIGNWMEKPADPSDLAMTLRYGDDVRAEGSTQAVLGDPRKSVAKAAEMLARHGHRLEAGWIILTGGATEAHALVPSARVSNAVEGLGEVEFFTAAGKQ